MSTNSDKLAEAARIIGEVIDKLDDSKELCGSCGRSHYKDYNQFQRKRELGVVQSKLFKQINAFKNNWKLDAPASEEAAHG